MFHMKRTHLRTIAAVAVALAVPACTSVTNGGKGADNGHATPAARTSGVANVTNGGSTKGPEIQTTDVDLFYRIYEAAGGRPTAEQLQRDYLDRGTDGLRQLAKMRNVTGVRIADAIAKTPEVYTKAKECMQALPRVRERLGVALAKLVSLYPEARLPPVTIVVGRGKPAGVGAPSTGVQIGLEALCAVQWMNPNVEDRFVYMIAHEYAHVQQAPEIEAKKTPTVLEMSLIEGVAEFVGELTSGSVSYVQFRTSTAGREKEIETAFAADVDKTDLSAWLYNGTAEKPGDLGYWVGYRIARAYYQNAADKRAAVREILQMTDANALLAKSGWYPGVQLQ